MPQKFPYYNRGYLAKFPTHGLLRYTPRIYHQDLLADHTNPNNNQTPPYIDPSKKENNSKY